MRLATYNIHGCVGRDGRADPSRILRVLEQLDADVVALQEVRHGEGDRDPLRYLARGLGCRAVAGPTLQRADGAYGNALLTRWPATVVNRLDLSVPRREPRGAIDARLERGPESVRVLATHLGLRPAERREQIERLLAHLGPDVPEVTVLMGDLNEWFLWGRPLRRLHRVFARTAARATYPARLPLLALDRIWVHPRHRLRRLEVFRGSPAAAASDHLPLVAEIDAEPGDGTAGEARRRSPGRKWSR